MYGQRVTRPKREHKVVKLLSREANADRTDKWLSCPPNAPHNGIRFTNSHSFARYEYLRINDSVYDFNYHLFVQRVHRRFFTAAKQTDSAVEHKQKLHFLSRRRCRRPVALPLPRAQSSASERCGLWNINETEVPLSDFSPYLRRC